MKSIALPSLTSLQRDAPELWSKVSKSGSDLLWVLTGKFALMGANAALMLFLARWLDLKTYGLLVLTISGQLLLSRILLVGVDAGMMRLTSVLDLQSRQREVVSAGLVVIGWTSGLLLMISPLALLSSHRFGIAGWLIVAVVMGSIGTALVDYGYSFRLEQQQYPQAALAQGGTAIWRLGITAIAAILLPSNPLAVFMAYHGASFSSGWVQTLLIASRNWRRPDRPLVTRLLRYSFWQGKASVLVIFSLYQGTFLLILLNDPIATGVFGLALTLSLGFFAIYNAYAEYLRSRIKSVERVTGFPKSLFQAFLVAVVLVLASAPVLFVLVRVLPWLLGPEWSGLVPVLVYLSAAMLLLVLQAPLEVACHFLLKPHLILVGWVTRAALVVFGGVMLAPRMGAEGVAIAQMIGFGSGLFVLAFLVFSSWRRVQQSETAETAGA